MFYFTINDSQKYLLRTTDIEDIEKYQVVCKKEFSKNKVQSVVPIDKRCSTVNLWENGRTFGKGVKKLVWDNVPYFKNKKANIQSSFEDVFGLEDKYCINMNDPTQVWSKQYNQFMKLNEDKYGHLYFASGTDYYIARIYYETYFKTKIPKGFVIHHISHQEQQNNIQNLLLLSFKTHNIFENYYRQYKYGMKYCLGRYKGKKKSGVKTISYQQMLQVIDTLDIKDEEKEILKKSL